MGDGVLRREAMEVRDYQRNIADAAIERNTLVVLPTGMGKTLISVIVAANRLEKFPESKILITAPTRPLNAQHKKSFEKFTSIPEDEIVLVTGKVNPNDREVIYKRSKVVVATPQTIQNDLKTGRLNMKDFSFVTFDEAHRASKDYAYPYIARTYMMQSKNPLILSLTASPGGTRDKIREICDNLFIKGVEIRTEYDYDVEQFVKPVQKEFVEVDFPQDLKKVRALIEEVFAEDCRWLKERHYVPVPRPNRRMLLAAQKRASAMYSNTKNYIYIWPLIRAVEAIKLSHAMEIIETQGVQFLYDYFQKIKSSSKKTDTRMMKNPKIYEAMRLVEEMNVGETEHPKMQKLSELVADFVQKNPDVKIIIFSNYRSTVDKIKKKLTDAGIKAAILVGQSSKNGTGMTQDQQLDVLTRFKEGEFNVLIGTSVSEEGIDVPSVDYAIFYEAVPSEIRAIQRRGRVGRQEAGKVIFLLTKGTRDEAYFFSSLSKERKMKDILRGIQRRGGIKRKKNLMDWVAE